MLSMHTLSTACSGVRHSAKKNWKVASANASRIKAPVRLMSPIPSSNAWVMSEFLSCLARSSPTGCETCGTGPIPREMVACKTAALLAAAACCPSLRFAAAACLAVFFGGCCVLEADPPPM